MFTGFERGTFEFFMALSFNNNREFFHANHGWYEKSVRDPLRELCMDLAPAMLTIDSDIEVRPARVISHINRDLRYSRDKSPYRDYMWLGFHRAGWDKRDCFHYYFDIGADCAHVGAGMYGDDRAWSDALRRFIRENPDEARALLDSEAVHAFELSGNSYKRMSVPEDLAPELVRWYPLKSMSLEHTYTPNELDSAALLDDIVARFNSLKPVYDLMYRIRPVRDEDAPDKSEIRAGSFAGTGAQYGWE